MDDKTFQALTALAGKLGTTAEYLWGVLVRQAPISAAIELTLLAAWVAACVWLVFFVRRNTAGDKPKWSDEVTRLFAWTGVVLVCSMTAISGGNAISDALTAIMNPEYWALRQILK